MTDYRNQILEMIVECEKEGIFKRNQKTESYCIVSNEFPKCKYFGNRRVYVFGQNNQMIIYRECLK